MFTQKQNKMLTATPEYYQLKCCETGTLLTVNSLPAKFVYTGLFNNENTPDSMYNKVLTRITDIHGNDIVGCYTLVDAECFDEWEEFNFNDIFFTVDCVNTCEECVPKHVHTPPVLNHKVIYPEFKVNNADPFDAEQIMCEYASGEYQKVLGLRYGIEFCCPVDLMQAKIELEILKMDMAEDIDACCNPQPSTTCKKYSITIPSNAEGILYFKDCNNVQRTVQFVKASQAYVVFICGITGQTNQDIYILVDHSTIMQVSFVENAESC
jgi:hypothetical protein